MSFLIYDTFYIFFKNIYFLKTNIVDLLILMLRGLFLKY